MADPPVEPGPGPSGGHSSGSPPDHGDDPGHHEPRLADLFALGTSCAICIVGAGAVGYLLDSTLHTTPWLTFTGLAFGVVSAVLLAVARLRKYL